MARLLVPESIDAASGASRSCLETVKKQLGMVPSLLRLMGNNPAVLDGYFGLYAALSKGRLSAQTRERIALAISEFNHCDYCVSAHTYVSRKLVGLDDAEITANRNGASKDIEADAAVRFAVAIASSRGNVSDGQIEAVKKAGYDDAQIVEIVQHVALTIFANYLDQVGKPEIDFPIIRTRRARERSSPSTENPP